MVHLSVLSFCKYAIKAFLQKNIYILSGEHFFVCSPNRMKNVKIFELLAKNN